MIMFHIRIFGGYFEIHGKHQERFFKIVVFRHNRIDLLESIENLTSL